MHLDPDDFLEGCDALDDTLRAARSTLQALAATSLPFAAQVRIERQSTERARAWARANLDLSPLPAIPAADRWANQGEAGTDEILLRALAEPASPPDPADADAPLIDFEPRDHSDGDAPLIELDLGDDELDLSPDGDLGDFDDFTDSEMDKSGLDVLSGDPHADDGAIDFGDSDFDSDGSFIAFDDDEEKPSDDDSDLPLLTLGPDTSVDSLISFEEGDDAEDLDDDEAIDDPDSITTPQPAGERVQAPPTEGDDNTLVADLESLVRLHDLLAEEEAPGVGPASERDDQDRTGEHSTTTLTNEDLGRLGFASEQDLIAPEGSDSDPASESGSGPTPQISSDSPVHARVAVGRGKSSRSSGASGPSIPTIRDQRPDRPAAAAIQLKPDGGAAVINEPITLELGEADEDWEDPSETGFSLQIEEYEPDLEAFDELESLDEAEEHAQHEDPVEPATMPSLSDGQIDTLLRQAESAADKGDLKAAIQLFSDALDFDPDNVTAAIGRGLAWLDLSDYARAMSDFTVAEDIAPEDARVNAAMGKLYYDRKDYGRAIEYLDRAVELDPKLAMAWCRRGISYYYRKDYPRAHEDLVQAQKLDADIPNIKTYIGMVRKRMR